MRIKNIIALTILAALFSPLAQAQSREWKVTKQWTPDLERKFSEFVAIMGEAVDAGNCGTLNKCLTKASSNPMYAARTPKDAGFYADCADLPFSLRAYFAWMEGLPFDYVNDVGQDPRNEGNDNRYGKFGNIPNGFRKIRATNSEGKSLVFDGPTELQNISNMVSTATYRMHPKYVSDFYPAGINTTDIRPGTVLYDPAGHAAIIYKVDKRDGTIRMIDGHPDGSITDITFDTKFVRSRKEHGAGFKNWRPELNYDATENLPRYSITERFQDSYELNGDSLNYYEYVRSMMAGGNSKVNPVADIKLMIGELCSNTHDRVKAVNDGLASGIQNHSHPSNLPRNIYGTNGEWEEYSTPSRDARLKTGFASLVSEMERLVQLYQDKPSRISYEPTASRYSGNCRSNDKVCFLGASLLEAYEEASNAPECSFQYTRSNGKVVTMGFEGIVSRLFKMSFDPYHCPELRWGATGSELSSCGDGSTKLAWYEAEQGLRNQIERKYDDVMDKDLNGTYSLGVSKAPNVDLVSFLESLL